MITENVRKIRTELDGINPAIKIVAATKTRTIEEIRECMNTGMVLAAGENRVQELTEKYTEDFRWDVIGRLQTNKVKYVVGRAELIHSLDRVNLAEEVQKECQKRGLTQKMLVEVNVGGEESKGGIEISNIDGFLDEISRFDKISVCGLMAVVPLYYTEYELKCAFDRMYEEFFKRKSGCFRELSMGMSSDYVIAAKCGATIVRPGTAIFGARSYIQ